MNSEDNNFNPFKGVHTLKICSCIIVLFLTSTQGALLGQSADVNICDFKFNVRIEKQYSIPLQNETGEIIRYWTQSEFEYITPYIVVDRSSTIMSRIKSIDVVVINYGEGSYDKTQIDSLNKSLGGLWIPNEYLKTGFSEWIYTMNRSGISKLANPIYINDFYMYARPTIETNKTAIDINDLYEGDSNEILYKILVLECKGEWVKVEISVDKLKRMYTGWMPWYNFCYNILTTCGMSNKRVVENAE